MIGLVNAEPSMPNSISKSQTLREILPLFTSILAPVVAMNALPGIRGSLGSSSYSMTTKSAGMRQLSTFTGTFSRIPSGTRLERSTKRRVILVGLQLVTPSLSATNFGMRLMNDQRSHSEWLNLLEEIEQSRTKLLGSRSFWARFFGVIVQIYSTMSTLLVVSVARRL